MTKKRWYKILILFLFCAIGSQAQKLRINTLPEGVQRAYVDGKDTIPVVNLQEVFVFPQMRFKNKREQEKYNKLVRDVKRTLPYAKMVYETLIETYEYMETLPDDKARQAHLKRMEKDLFKEAAIIAFLSTLTMHVHFQKVDTVWTPVDFDFFRDSVNTLNYFIRRPWKYGEEYRLSVDSATIFSLYDKWNEPYSGEFKIKKEDEYGHLYLNIEGIDTTAYVELLNSSDTPVRKVKVKNGGALFMDLKPDKYYVRLVVDLNDNGKWDTGNYADKRQPEEVFYSPVKYNVMQNWQVEETWNVKATPLAKQKPIEITKNKPKEATKKKRNYKDEGQQKSSSRNSSGNMGMPF